MNRQFISTLRFVILTLILFPASGNGLIAADYEIVKIDSIEFEIQTNGLLTLRVGSGLLDIKVWDRPFVFVKTKKWVSEDNQADAEEKMADLEIEFSNNRDGLLIRELARGSKNPFSGLLKSAGIKDDPKSQIDFSVFVPRSVSLNITKEGGDSDLTEIRGNLTIDQEKGRLRIEGLASKRLEMKLDFVDARIKFMNSSLVEDVHINFSIDRGEMTIHDAKIIRLVAQSKEADLYLVNNEISSGEIRLDSGDFFFNSNLDLGSRLRVHSDSGDMYLLLPVQPEFGIKAETGLGLIGNQHGWDIEDRGSGFLMEHPSRLQRAGRGEFITEIGDIFIQKKWNR